MPRQARRRIQKAKTPQQLARLMKTHGDLLAVARDGVDKDIALIAGEAKVSADQIRAAVTKAREIVDKVEKLKSRLAKLGAVLDFFAAVATGSATKIFAAAKAPKTELDKP